MFEKIIEKVIVEQNARKHERPHTVHWPSESSIIYRGDMIGSCMREKYLQRMGYPADKTTSVENIRKMKIGKMIEQSEIELGKVAGIWVADDVGFKMASDNIIISGKLDAIYRDSKGNNVCVEYKTSSGWDFTKKVYGGSGANSRAYAMPKMEHVLQTMIYLHALPELTYGIIFYLNRESMATIEHTVMKSEDGGLLINKKPYAITLDMVTSRYKTLTEHLQNATIPPADYLPIYDEDDIEGLYLRKTVSKYDYDNWNRTGAIPSDRQCSWCLWSETCKKMERATMVPKTKEDKQLELDEIMKEVEKDMEDMEENEEALISL